MLFHTIEISQNFSRSPQQMPRGHVFPLTWNWEVSPCRGRRMMVLVGQHPRGASQGSILAFPLHLVASGVIPPPRAKPSTVDPLHLSCPSNLVYFFPLWMLGFLCRCPSPRWQAGGKLAKALLTQAVLPDFRGERVFFQRTAGLGQSSPYCYL